MATALSARVCDRCIKKKVKCDLARPSCSRCRESHQPCIYSARRRKPGPAKGFRKRRADISRTSISTPSKPTDAPETVKDDSGSPIDPFSFLPTELYPESLHTGLEDSSPEDWPHQTETSPPATQDPSSPIVYLNLSFEQEYKLLDTYFKSIHPATRLFRENEFYERYSNGTLDHNLVVTVLLISAKIRPNTIVCDQAFFDISMSKMLELNPANNDSLGGGMSLEDFQRACLLTHYEFFQRPGSRAWSLLGQLSRQAYHCGLHQIDSDTGSPFSAITNPAVLEEWRYVWWCIYCFDSYSNQSAATPFVIELDSIRTALVSSSLENTGWTQDHSGGRLFLCDDADLLWQTAMDMTRFPDTYNYNAQIVMTTALKEAGALFRLSRMGSSRRLAKRVLALEQHLNMMQSSLPAGFLDATRNDAVNESGLDYHARLICILQYRFSRVFAAVSLFHDKSAPPDISQWCKVMEHCHGVVGAINQFDVQFCTTVDPAICLIAAIVLMFLSFSTMSDSQVDVGPRGKLEAEKVTLLRFLESFAVIWALPRYLIGQYQERVALMPRIQSVAEIDHQLQLMPAPLQSKPATVPGINVPQSLPDVMSSTISQIAPEQATRATNAIDYMQLFHDFDFATFDQGQGTDVEGIINTSHFRGF